MKICFIAPASSAHIVKWCDWFASHGHEVHVISFTRGDIPSATVHLIDIGIDVKSSNDLAKLKYLTNGKKIRSLVDELNPDIINVHYATSYGAAVALSGLKRKYFLSVWGADVYDFPRKSFFHKFLLEYSLNKADILFSTSCAMARETSKYTDKQFEITPFGVDIELFNPQKRDRNDNNIVIGTVKALADKYGIADILKAVAKVRNNTRAQIFLRIAGSGPQESEYHKLAKELGIEDITIWLGYISQQDAAKEWANMDIAVIPSTLESESFGVSVVEAQASGIATIISDIPGLMEASLPGESSIVVQRKNPDLLANAILDLIDNPQKRKLMGSNGRKYVSEKYSLDDCFANVERIYKNKLRHSTT